MILSQETIILSPTARRTHRHGNTITWIKRHGPGHSTGRYYARDRRIMALSDYDLVLPTAPTMAVTLNNRMLMPAWYDIISLEPLQVDCTGMKDALKNLDQLIQQEISHQHSCG